MAKRLVVMRTTIAEKTIREMDIAEPIKIRALRNLRTIEETAKTRSFKERTRNMVVFACVFKAYYSLGVSADPSYVLKQIKINAPVGKSLAKYAPEIRLTIDSMAVFYADIYISTKRLKVNRDELISSLVTFVKQCVAERGAVRVWIGSNCVANCAIGIATFHLFEMIGLEFDIQRWSEICSLTPCCIMKYKDSFEDCYNM